MEAAVAEIKPNAKKAFVLNILIVLGIVALVVGALIYLNSVVGLNVFLDTFKELGIVVSPGSVLLWLIFLVLFVTGLLLFLNYVSLCKVTYTLYPNKIVYSKSLFIMHVGNKIIPYFNIAKITYKSKPFLNSSKVIIELTGMKEGKFEMDFIDDAEEVIKKIGDLIREERARYYTQYAQNYRMQNIVDRY